MDSLKSFSKAANKFWKKLAQEASYTQVGEGHVPTPTGKIKELATVLLDLIRKDSKDENKQSVWASTNDDLINQTTALISILENLKSPKSISSDIWKNPVAILNTLEDKLKTMQNLDDVNPIGTQVTFWKPYFDAVKAAKDWVTKVKSSTSISDQAISDEVLFKVTALLGVAKFGKLLDLLLNEAMPQAKEKLTKIKSEFDSLKVNDGRDPFTKLNDLTTALESMPDAFMTSGGDNRVVIADPQTGMVTSLKDLKSKYLKIIKENV